MALIYYMHVNAKNCKLTDEKAKQNKKKQKQQQQNVQNSHRVWDYVTCRWENGKGIKYNINSIKRVLEIEVNILIHAVCSLFNAIHSTLSLHS